MKVICRVKVTPSTDAIIPPFSSKVGKTLLGGTKLNVSISPLWDGKKYLFKAGDVPLPMTVYAGDDYWFRIGGDEKDVARAITSLRETKVFNTWWHVRDVEVNQVENVPSDAKKMVVETMTPAILPDPFNPKKRKRFSNEFVTVFAVNFMDELKFTREDVKEKLATIEEVVTEEPSWMRWETVNYAGKRVVGVTGKFTYSSERLGEIMPVLENAIAKGIGSSRRNGFGIVKITLESKNVKVTFY
ncbi:CRISPR-associated endoribonuclease Cas6 [Sulfuracidifex metallicus]|uniref:CRISPR-associated endoribonuclease Cas6 n=1 Tax=Sulfuracidifex metallicus DSM 6482 = JCM 9184 TaxID=523847 RepID=A0A6A9QR07_SULME|nr:CRISPR-associated endoribonuclease Cas6 [Sulfuracidifex metallicus]MUN29735.1 CRISPR-associated endoribonuclease Cas6 [Sulfuracidifex metallicus DSM 6482 = JCM 9184]WOE51887.1 CRISPR-associated endoribonuclease Cas6 [Sulfuracidifex metallicus DSM 6482 = JCM 9184]